MQVVTIDPGDTTGYVVANIEDTLLRLYPSQAKHSPKQFYDFLVGLNPQQVLCENFRCRNTGPGNLGLSMTSAHLIGVTMLYCEELDIPLRLQEPSYGEGGHFRGINTLKRHGVYIGGANYHHAMEAMRGFMQWYWFGPGFKYNKLSKVDPSKGVELIK